MTDKEKIIKIKSLADKMYDAAFNLTTDTSLLRKTMDDYHQFIIQEWHKKEPVSEELEEAVNAYIGYAPEVDECSSVYGKRQAFKAGAQWQKGQMMRGAVDAFIYNENIRLKEWPLSEKYGKHLDSVKLIIIKKNKDE